MLSIKWANKAWWWSTNRWIHFSNRIIETMYNDIVMLIVSYIKKTNKTCEPLQRQRIFLNAIYCVLYDGWGKPISPAVKNHKINGKIRCSYLWQRSGCFKWDKIDSYINIRLDSGLALGSSCLNVQCCLVYVKLCSPSCLVYVKLCSQSCLVYIKLWSPSCLVYVKLCSSSCIVYVKLWSPSCLVYVKLWSPSCIVYVKLWCPSCLVYVKLWSPSCLVYVKLWSPSCLVYVKLWSPSCLVYVNLWSPSCFVYVKPT